MTEAEKIYKHTYFIIGETLVEESKQHITSEKACDKIREYLKEMIWKLNKGVWTEMSWWSDGEPFDEYDPPYCKDCNLLSCENCEYEKDD